ncbi:glycosyltransferase family 2 protein [Pelagibacterium lacus]|uniref:Glycosyltransferase family 2 protein n=1 Tax=Pelagibacterium lacus TaxID=2282655 RepID=A0A369W5H9_9HYPH|nr:glycosyltransferase family A protein [Pelagibacterium lacus]RDE09279.1 glycosyltransferase family 2 protein [Pelagibacterium lacus]
MDVAFVIPAHNEEALLGDCLKSVLEEIDRSALCSRAEVVVVDNASTDGTSAVAGAFDRVKVVLETRKGLGYARSAGFENSTGLYVANIDADTIVPPGWLDTALSEFKKDEGLVCVSGPYIYHDLPWTSRAITEGFYWLTKAIYLINRYVLKVGSVVQGGNFVFRRDAWLKAGGYNQSITFYGEDTDIAVRLSRVGGVKWTFKLRMLTSGRRLQKQGVVRTGLTYTLNFFAVTFRGKPVTSDYTDYRD